MSILLLLKITEIPFTKCRLIAHFSGKKIIIQDVNKTVSLAIKTAVK